MNIPLYIVDAFTSTLFRGNPAAVCPLDSWLPDALMQDIAAENNLAETAFCVQAGRSWDLRWFTPLVEVDLCGHATLAAAFVLAREHPELDIFSFNTRSGELTVTKQDALLTLNFPTRSLQPLALEPEVRIALGVPVVAVTKAAGTLIAELDSEAAVRALRPDFRRVLSLNCAGLSVTARGADCDFVSRFFAPSMGINEDAVTGSAHCGLVPYWAVKLARTSMVARQLSARGGELQCQLLDGRVLLGGHAVLYSKGDILLP